MSVFKRVRCLDCGKMRDDSKPKKVAPKCPSCGGTSEYMDNWYIRWKQNGVQHKKAIGPNKKHAEAALNRVRLNIAEGRAGLNTVKKTTWKDAADAFDDYIEGHLRPKSQRQYRHSMRLLKEYFGDMTLDQVTPDKVEQFKADRLKSVKPSTVNRDITTIKRLFSLAEDWGMVENNKIRKVKKFEEVPCERFLSAEEEHRLLEECKTPHLKMAVLIALDTGMRKENVLSIQWRNINFASNVITVRLVKKRGHATVSIPMTRRLRTALRAHKKESKVMSQYVIPSPRNPHTHMKVDADFGFETACKRAGLDGFRFHDLRHTFASNFAMRTGNLGALQEILGHSDPSVTKRYAHFAAQAKQALMQQYEGGPNFLDGQGLPNGCQQQQTN